MTGPLPLPLLARGKVRELYDAGPEAVLIVASDRISAYDVVLPTQIPDKGAVLTGLTLWWFAQLADLVPNHLISAEVSDYPAELAPYAELLRGRSMLCRRLSMVPVECVVRGYLAGSGWTDYAATRTVCGIELPAGLREGDRLPSSIFTPTTKGAAGEHDQSLTAADAAGLIGADVLAELSAVSRAVYNRAAEIAAERGLLLADTKFEFGHDADRLLTLGDEVLTPDSSRFWPTDRWLPGGPQPSYDKQYVRDWLTTQSGWDHTSPPPALPDDVVRRTRDRYVDAYERLTGTAFADYPRRMPD